MTCPACHSADVRRATAYQCNTCEVYWQCNTCHAEWQHACPAVSERGKRCIRNDGAHAEHKAWVDGKVVSWR